jgi:hypothetical protein
VLPPDTAAASEGGGQPILFGQRDEALAMGRQEAIRHIRQAAVGLARKIADSAINLQGALDRHPARDHAEYRGGGFHFRHEEIEIRGRGWIEEDGDALHGRCDLLE